MLFVNLCRTILSNVAEFYMHLIVFHGKNEIEKSEKSTKKRDSRREKRDLDFSLSLGNGYLNWLRVPVHQLWTR